MAVDRRAITLTRTQSAARVPLIYTLREPLAAPPLAASATAASANRPTATTLVARAAAGWIETWQTRHLPTSKHDARLLASCNNGFPNALHRFDRSRRRRLRHQLHKRWRGGEAERRRGGEVRWVKSWLGRRMRFKRWCVRRKAMRHQICR